MGTTYSCDYVRTDSAEAVFIALDRAGIVAFVSDSVDGWVAFYEDTHRPGVGLLDPRPNVSQYISETLDAVVLNVWMVDSDVDGYTLYEAGREVDGYVSDPFCYMEPEDRKEMATPEALAKFAGNPDTLLPYCLPGTTPEAVQVAFAPCDYESRDAVGERILPLFGISETFGYSLAFRFIAGGEAEFAVRLSAASHLTQSEKDKWLREALDSMRFPIASMPSAPQMAEFWRSIGAVG